MKTEKVVKTVDDELEVIRAKFARLTEQRDKLRVQIALQEKPKTDGDLAEILRAALRGEAGWGERARLALGDYKMIECENCGAPFPSGGKRKKNCGSC